ncbi:MAG: creatininase family protein [Candidatus Limnocylindria bacterium]
MSDIDEVRLERLRPAGLEAALARGPIAWIPLGAIEFHAPHLPFGTDGFTGHGLLERAARRAGGVVLPWSYLTIGTLHFPWTFRYDPAVVAASVLATVRQAADFGARVAVVHTGHAPLDLVHLLKRTCAEAEAEIGAGFRAYGLTYLELNAALGAGLGTDWPVAVDHGSILETSWMLALEPDLVDLAALPGTDQPAAVGIYGPDPRAGASAERGRAPLEAAADLLAERARALLDGAAFDPLADLRVFVERYWPEAMEVGVGSGTDGEAVLTLAHPGPVSRYLTALGLDLDGRPVAPDSLTLHNPTPGEPPRPVPASTLGPESGFYVRRAQTARLHLADGLPAGRHRVRLRLGLAGVTSTDIDATVDVPAR